MIFTNDKAHGGKFKTHFLSQLKGATKLTIATGYFGTGLVQELEPKLLALSKKGECRILLGMVFHGGISAKQTQCLKRLDEKLRAFNPANGVYISTKAYHGKVYKIDDDVYLGSSNFSSEGFGTRLECTAQLSDSSTIKATVDYVDFLFSSKSTVRLSDVELRTKKAVAAERPNRSYKSYTIAPRLVPDITKSIGRVDIKLRVDDQPASSLNLYFESGRKNKKGLYAPRPWYEVEITSSASERRSPFYPKSKLKKKGKKSREGQFNAYICEGDDVYMIRMKVASDNGKAIMSSGDDGGRQTLGSYIKGKLEDSGVLKRGELITSDVLEAYGRDSISLIKIDDKNYFLQF